MYWSFMILLAAQAIAVRDDSGVKQPGITQFWTDDYKVFDQIYGKTSDKDIYGSSLPASISYGIDASKFQKLDLFKPTIKDIKTNDDDTTASGSQIDAYGFGDNFAHLRQKVKYSKDIFKPAKSTNFVYNAFKPITEESDPETYDYLKHLEEMGKQLEYPHKTLNNFQPYNGASFRANPGVDYKSIQDILDAQEGKKKEPSKQLEDDDIKYINYPTHQYSRGKKPNVRLNQSNSINSSRCGGKNQGRCRKRSNYKQTGSYGRYKPRPRPVIRKIKTIITE